MTPSSFDNGGIVPVREDKPHLVFIDGYWRVSKLPRLGWLNPKLRWKFMVAHEYAAAENNKLAFKELVACL